MSFFSGNQNGIFPGPIHGNPLWGLRERTCIETKKILDACSRRIPLKDHHVKLENKFSPCMNGPITFIEAHICGPAKIIDQVIERLDEHPNFARVSIKSEIPIEIIYTDADNNRCEGASCITITNDVILFVPRPSIVPFNVEVFAAMSETIGSWMNDNEFSITCCITLIEKIVAVVDILVPSYGFCYAPECQEFAERICRRELELPLFPSAER